MPSRRGPYLPLTSALMSVSGLHRRIQRNAKPRESRHIWRGARRLSHCHRIAKRMVRDAVWSEPVSPNSRTRIF